MEKAPVITLLFTDFLRIHLNYEENVHSFWRNGGFDGANGVADGGANGRRRGCGGGCRWGGCCRGRRGRECEWFRKHRSAATASSRANRRGCVERREYHVPMLLRLLRSRSSRNNSWLLIRARVWSGTNASGDQSAQQQPVSPTSRPGGTNVVYATNSASMTNTPEWLQRDQAITAQDQAVLQQMRQAVFQGQPTANWMQSIHFILKDGAVRFVGTVPSPAERQRIESIVAQIPGVVRVYDAVAVNASAGADASTRRRRTRATRRNSSIG